MGTSTPPSSKPKQLVTRLLGLAYGYLEGRVPPSEVAKECRAIADWVEGAKAPEAKPAKPAAPKAAAPKAESAPVAEVPKPKSLTPQVKEVFDYWQRRLGKNAAKLTNDRVSKIQARLREGYTVAQIRAAIDALSTSAWHRGENDKGRAFDDITLICQSGSKLEGFIEMAGESGISPAPTVEDHSQDDVPNDRLAELRREAQEALKEGKMDAYSEAQRAIKSLTRGAGPKS